MTVDVNPSVAADAVALSVPDLDPDADTLGAALVYAHAGWYVGPVRRAGKHPGAILGKGWETRTSRDPQTIVGWFAGTDHGVFLHAGRSGAVIFDVDHPDRLPEVLATALHDAPPPYQGTRSDTPERGHYLYATPPGRRIGNGTGRLGASWGEVRGTNGVVVVAPSVHEKADQGGIYWWHRTGPLPTLPASIAAALPDATDTAAAVTAADVVEFLDRHTASARSYLLCTVVKRLDQRLGKGGSRHDAARDALCQAMREAQAGLYPARDAVDAIRERFTAAVAGERRDPNEWPGLVAWAVAQGQLDDPAARRENIEARIGPVPPDEPDQDDEPGDPGPDPWVGLPTAGEQATEPEPPTPPEPNQPLDEPEAAADDAYERRSEWQRRLGEEVEKERARRQAKRVVEAEDAPPLRVLDFADFLSSPKPEPLVEGLLLSTASEL